MTWYQAGTVTLTNGSTQVDGAGTDFLPPNVVVGDGFADENGVVYEITGITSSTRLSISPAYRAASGGGRLYKIIPTPDYQRLLAMRALDLLNDFGAVRDGIGKGLIADGTPAAPGIRFAADQDTGVRRYAPNVLSIVTGGVDRLIADERGYVGVGTLTPNARLSVAGNISIPFDCGIGYDPEGQRGQINGGTILLYGMTVYNPATGDRRMALSSYGGIDFVTQGARRASFDSDGNFLVGIASASEHTITKPAGQGSAVLRVRSSAGGALDSLVVASVSNYSVNGAGAAIYVGKSTATDRSAAFAGTVNASGADYAEYMAKADGCGPIAKGDVCGVDADGKLTRTWAAAISFVVKSTDPSLVGGDVWAGHLGPKPEPIGAEPTLPGEAPAMPIVDDPEALAVWRESVTAHTALVAAYPALRAQWVADQAEYEAALAAWEADLESARQCVDRIAFCGQVPVNVTGDFAVGDYIIPAANGGGIKAIAVAETDITFDQYRRRIGKVWAVRDGRAWIDVQHG